MVVKETKKLLKLLEVMKCTRIEKWERCKITPENGFHMIIAIDRRISSKRGGEAEKKMPRNGRLPSFFLCLPTSLTRFCAVQKTTSSSTLLTIPCASQWVFYHFPLTFSLVSQTALVDDRVCCTSAKKFCSRARRQPQMEKGHH